MVVISLIMKKIGKPLRERPNEYNSEPQYEGSNTLLCATSLAAIQTVI